MFPNSSITGGDHKTIYYKELGLLHKNKYPHDWAIFLFVLFITLSVLVTGSFLFLPKSSSDCTPSCSHDECFFQLTSLLKDKNYCMAFFKQSDDDQLICYWLHYHNSDEHNNRRDREAMFSHWLHSLDHNASTSKLKAVLTNVRTQALKYFFRPRISTSDKELMLNVTKMCLSVAQSIGAQHFIFAGTLVGYVRHNFSVIPWDDDVDVGLIIRRPDEAPLMAAKLQAMGEVMYGKALKMRYIKSLKRVKCYFTSSPPATSISGYDWTWPFVDFQFMRFKSFGLFQTHRFLENMDLRYELYDEDDILPLQPAVFTEANISIFIPKNPYKAVAVTFPGIMKICQSPSYNHRTESPYPHFVTANCSEVSKSLLSNYDQND